MVPAQIPSPPPIPTALLQQPLVAPPRNSGVPAWAMSFALHCLAIILLGIGAHQAQLDGSPGNGEMSISWASGDATDPAELDSGALGGLADESISALPSASENLVEFSTTALDRLTELTSAPASLKLEIAGAGKSGANGLGDLSGLLGGTKTSTGAGNGFGADFAKQHGYGKTKFFGVESEGSKFVYVFDRSYSMNEFNHTPLLAAKQELLSSINQLTDQQQFYIVFYNHEPYWYEPVNGNTRGRLHFATGENKSRFHEFIYSVTADGGTRHLPALEKAIRSRPDVIYLMTDGEEKDDLSHSELQHITRMNSGGATIHVIQFAPEPRPNSTLVQLAKRNHGKHRFIDITRLAERLVNAAAAP